VPAAQGGAQSAAENQAVNAAAVAEPPPAVVVGVAAETGGSDSGVRSDVAGAPGQVAGPDPAATPSVHLTAARTQCNVSMAPASAIASLSRGGGCGGGAGTTRGGPSSSVALPAAEQTAVSS
jgi:hypothetical protein